MLSRLTPYRLRLLLRGVFLLLSLAVIAMALYVLWEEKKLSYHNYQYSFYKTEAQLVAKLHHPAGQLALLNPPKAVSGNAAGLRPLLLPFASLDFDDRNKVRQAIDMSGCLVQYPPQGSLCAAIGSNPWAGGFIYVAGSFRDGTLIPHERGDHRIDQAHRVRVQVSLRGQSYRWIAPFELGDIAASGSEGVQGRLTGFIDTGSPLVSGRPVRDFRGWAWQESPCLDSPHSVPCQKQVLFSVRLPVTVLRDDLFRKSYPVWPPADLDSIAVHVEVLPPGDGPALLDSNSAVAVPPFSLRDLTPLLLPGENLRIRKLSDDGRQELLSLTGNSLRPDNYSRLLSGLIRRLPVEGYDQPLQTRNVIATPLGSYELILTGDVGTVNRALGAVATRVSWFVAAMLLALLLAWFVIEIGIIRRMTVLTQRAMRVSHSVRSTTDISPQDLADLRGCDELGLLASCLYDLLQRVREDVERERIRSEQEKDMWHAVGHEIMSPLQSLMALHSDQSDESSRYINRMQQAIRVLYGTASPSEAFQATTLQAEPVDIAVFLRHVAENAPCAGIKDVLFDGPAEPVVVRIDDYSLEDVVTHVLKNADRFRRPGSAIRMTLEIVDNLALLAIRNEGPAIQEELIGKIFEYGVTDEQEAPGNGHRGQGLFVARTYMAKMGGTISACNEVDGVSFILSLPRVYALPA